MILLKKKLASFYRLCSKIEGEFFSKAKQKGMELFRFNFSQAATKSYLIYCGAIILLRTGTD